MDIRLVRSWASPSTLHLRVMVTAKSGNWSVFRDVHIEKDNLPLEDLERMIRSGRVDSVEPEVQPGFW